MLLRYLLLTAVAISLAACKYVPKLDEVLPDKRNEYRKSSTLPDLEVPPDLSSEQIQDKMTVPQEGATFSTYQERSAARKKQREEAGLASNAVETLSGERALVVPGDMHEVWDRVHGYWKARGFTLNLDDNQYAIQETAWREDKERLVRDRCKVFFEAGEQAGSTTLYVSRDSEEQKPEGETLVWKPQPRDAVADGKILDDLKAYLGGGSQAPGTATASQPDAAPLHADIVNSGDGKLLLSVATEFAETWSATGKALTRTTLTVDNADKEHGIYRVHYATAPDSIKKGMLSRLAFWKDKITNPHQISITGVGKKTEIVVLSDSGKWDGGDVANQILSDLQAALNQAP